LNVHEFKTQEKGCSRNRKLSELFGAFWEFAKGCMSKYVMSEFMVKWAIYGPAVDPDILHLMGKF
jgi:hypothetical protein